MLLSFKDDVRIVLTDVVEFEATHRAEDLPDAKAIKDFLEENRDRIEIMPTTIGSLALADLKRKHDAGETTFLAKDVGELSLTSSPP